ncbi:hypothetical protein [Prevotella sp. OH937_COT-195]|uniref:hypothetical protein n=1 Tax=Prevotella sp. OH937_COT-195 TaxID=2491051 RepID=UPI000F65489C|nr:hypothetical protein [Prevotella sp. OH937_COT-195]RRD01971.1 hypothetical protein EII32_05345 [Prevotella sp. OH937_COT-195]
MKIKDLQVKVIYRVGLSDVEVSDELYEALQYLADHGMTRGDLVSADEQITTAIEWLEDNICETDAYEWKYEIEDMENNEYEQGKTSY